MMVWERSPQKMCVIAAQIQYRGRELIETPEPALFVCCRGRLEGKKGSKIDARRHKETRSFRPDVPRTLQKHGGAPRH